jgi:CRP-like cAMP-binding protein
MTADPIWQLFEQAQPEPCGFEAKRNLLRRGEVRPTVSLLVEGWAMRHRWLPGGRLQACSILLPGELCDPHMSWIGPLDHDIYALTPVRIRMIERERFDDLLLESRALARAVWRQDLQRDAIHCESLAAIGQKSARERVAHVLAETYVRMCQLGLASANSCELPLTQTDIGDLVGLTGVHVNRTLQNLRREGLVELTRRRLRIPDLQQLLGVARLDTAYLGIFRTLPGDRFSTGRRDIHPSGHSSGLSAGQASESR